ncbi:MAG: hypothetical protein QOC86_2814, partial [Gaiellales bacterium]|nr:hypothetical protein [Gaiellales bacterium]
NGVQRSTRARVRRLATVLATLTTLAGGTLATAGAAQAGDLIVLAPDTATIAGTLAYDHVYIGEGATLRLAGDTALSANDVYLAGGSSLRTCYVTGMTDTSCTAGRNLLIQSTGQINIGSGINLTAGSGVARPGGSLQMSGAAITVSGGIDTSGSAGGGSGYVAISSAGQIALSAGAFQASVNAPGAPVAIHGGTAVGLTGDLNTGGSDGAIISAGEIDVGATKGPVSIRGDVIASGRDGTGGSGNNVSLHGTDVRVGRVDASAATGSPGAVGIAGNVGIGGTTSVSIANDVDVRGASGPAGSNASPAGSVSITSSGPILAGNIFASGSDGNAAAPSAPGSIVISGSAVAVGQLLVNGGSRTGAGGGYGAYGGGVAVSATGALSVDEIEAGGGNSAGGFPGGHGGQIVLTGDGIFTSELRTTAGNSGGNAGGASSGPIIVNGKSAVTILGGVYTFGGSASGGAMSPAGGGGAGGDVALHASAGPLSLSAPIRTNGGNGGNAPAGFKAGSGGPGGAVDLVGTPIDPIAGISSEGGDGGFSNDTDHRGAGGAGGLVHAWSETNVSGSGLRSISTAGGSGVPPGVDGAQLQDSGPTGLSIDVNGLISFTSQSPSAEGFRVIRTLGDAVTVVLTTRTTARVALPALDVCVPVTYQVQAFQSVVGWSSPLTPAVPYIRQPSATQKCTDAPTLTHSGTVLVKQSNLTKAKGTFSFNVQANGIGAVTATATSKGVKTPIAVTTGAGAKPGSYKIVDKLEKTQKLAYKQPKKKKGKKKRPPAVARLTVTLVAAAPSGKATTSITVPVEVRK